MQAKIAYQATKPQKLQRTLLYSNSKHSLSVSFRVAAFWKNSWKVLQHCKKKWALSLSLLRLQIWRFFLHAFYTRLTFTPYLQKYQLMRRTLCKHENERPARQTIPHHFFCPSCHHLHYVQVTLNIAPSIVMPQTQAGMMPILMMSDPRKNWMDMMLILFPHFCTWVEWEKWKKAETKSWGDHAS
jgi:hypothetical protein